MPATESTIPGDWITLADQDIRAAEILLQSGGPLTIAAFLLQQSAEKQLKAFLLSVGWTLRRIHDLEVLLQEASAFDTTFTRYLSDMQRITEYYIESRYPIGVSTPLSQALIEADLIVIQDLRELLRQKLGF